MLFKRLQNAPISAIFAILTYLGFCNEINTSGSCINFVLVCEEASEDLLNMFCPLRFSKNNKKKPLFLGSVKESRSKIEVWQFLKNILWPT